MYSEKDIEVHDSWCKWGFEPGLVFLKAPGPWGGEGVVLILDVTRLKGFRHGY